MFYFQCTNGVQEQHGSSTVEADVNWKSAAVQLNKPGAVKILANELLFLKRLLVFPSFSFLAFSTEKQHVNIAFGPLSPSQSFMLVLCYHT